MASQRTAEGESRQKIKECRRDGSLIPRTTRAKGSQRTKPGDQIGSGKSPEERRGLRQETEARNETPS